MTNLQCHKNFTKVRKIEWAFLGGNERAVKMKDYLNPDFIGPIEPPVSLTKEQKAAFVVSLLNTPRAVFFDEKVDGDFDIAIGY